LLASKGNLTTNTIERRSQTLKLLAELEDELDKALCLGKHSQSRTKRYEKSTVDLADAADAIIRNKLFDCIPGRAHDGNLCVTSCTNYVLLCLKFFFITGFKDFKFCLTFIDDIEKFKSELNRLSRRMDSVEGYLQEVRSAAQPKEQSGGVSLDEDFVIHRRSK
jgi:hypothetical protein